MRDDDEKANDLKEEVALTEATPPKTEPEAKPVVDTKEFESIAERKAQEAEERAYRRAQSKADKDLEALRKQFREREQGLIDTFREIGADEAQVLAIKSRRAQADEREDLRAKVSMYDAEQQRQMAINAVADEIARACELADVDPTDKRLDKSNPDKFYASLKAIKQDRAKPAPTTPATHPPPASGNGAKDKPVEPLGSGGTGLREELPDDPDELWNMARKTTPSLRGRV